MNTAQSLDSKLKAALEKLKTITPRNPPTVGIHCERWPRMERCHSNVKQAMQAMRNAL